MLGRWNDLTAPVQNYSSPPDHPRAEVLLARDTVGDGENSEGRKGREGGGE